jgi:hypothetical protein
MKKQFYLLVLALANLLMAQSVIAQSTGIEFSVVAGISKSSIYGDSESYKDPVGGMAGVIVNFAKIYDESLSFRAELNISMQGAKWEDDYGEGLIKGSTNLLYLNLPIVARYQFKYGFFCEIGVQPGFLLSAKDKSEGTSVDVKDYLNKFDFGIPLGVGYEFKNNLGIGIRVVPGLANINEDATAKDHNLVATLRMTYTFKKK